MSLTFSLLTITRYKRIAFLPLLFKSASRALSFNKSRYNFIEWVFVDGSVSKKQSELLRKTLNKLSHTYKIKISIHIPPNTQRNIGYLREFSNSCISSETNVIICQDDDDYMLEQRIFRTCEIFSSNKDCSLVGCGNQFMYDYDTDTIFTFDLKMHPPYHAVNSTFAYTRDYALSHHYDTSLLFAEENSFTNDFTNILYHLSPLYCIIQMSYANNTYNKFVCKYQALSLRQYDIKTLCVPLKEYFDVDLNYFISDEDISSYKSIFDNEIHYSSDHNTYDITYICGADTIKWSPKNKFKLGGSESAVVNLAENWVLSGKSVEVYLNDPELEFLNTFYYKGVVYKHINKFCFSKSYNHIILWRVAGLLLLNKYIDIKAKTINIDLHDHNPTQYEIMSVYNSHINKIFYKSSFHKEIGNIVCPAFESISAEKSVIIPNGCDLELFTYRPEIKKDPWRFVFASSYFRGLKETLTFTWNIIFNFVKNTYGIEPSLHLYYGFHDNDPVKERLELERLIKSTPGVFDHGRISREELAIEKMKSTHHLYISLDTSEICCISLKESLLSQCILITSNVNIFGSFPSMKMIYNKQQSVDEFYIQCGNSFCEEVAKDTYPQDSNNLIQFGLKFPSIQSWESASSFWLKALF